MGSNASTWNYDFLFTSLSKNEAELSVGVVVVKIHQALVSLLKLPHWQQSKKITLKIGYVV